MKREWTPDQVATIIKLYTKKGWTAREIAHKFSTKAEKISKIIKENGFKITRRKVNRCLNEEYFDVIDNSEKAYFLGLLLADGCVRTDGGCEREPMVSLELVETDKDILDILKDRLCVGSELKYNKRKNRKNGTFKLSFRSKRIADSLEKYGMCSNKTYALTCLPRIESIYIPHLIRGLIDGDGSIYYSKERWHVNFTGYMYEWVYNFMGTVCDLIGKKKYLAITCYNNIHKVTFNGKDAKRLVAAAGYLNDDCCAIARKRSLAIRAYNETVGKDIV